MQQNDLSKLRARAFRKVMTSAERTLWFALRDRRFMDMKFRRQVPLGPWIADFYCARHKLILEADGDSHDGARDAIRDRWLQDRGFRTLRLRNHEVLCNLAGCLEWLAGEIAP